MAARDALVHAVIGDPARLPPPASLDLAAFWARYRAVAPLHLRLGFAVSTTVLAHVLPRALGHRRALARLGPDDADRLIQRAGAAPGLDVLVEVAKTVACFAYLSDPEVALAVRRDGAAPA